MTAIGDLEPQELVKLALKGQLPHDVVVARGHPNVVASNKSTMEVTRDPYVTRRGDCIVACCADKAAGDLTVAEALASRGSVLVALECGGFWDYVRGLTPGARPTSRHRIVLRRSGHVDDSTIMVRADKAAGDLDRRLVENIRGGNLLRLVIVVYAGHQAPGGP